MDKYDVVITPKTGWFELDIKELWKYRDLIGLFVKRNFISQYKQTVLGPAWAIIQPLLTTMIFTVVFGSLAGLAADDIPSFLFYMSGTITWNYFSICLIQTADTFVGNAGILGKVYFPRLVMPVSAVLTNLISFSIQFFMFIGFLFYYYCKGEVYPTSYILLFPLLVMQMAMLGLGSGIIISALTTKYRDLRMLVSFGVQLWMYGTPVAYDMRIIPKQFLGLYMLNPMTPVINTFRKAFLGTGEFSMKYYCIGWVNTIIILLIGIVMFNRVEKTFMDTV